jgi:hypothetical protein
MTENMSAAEMRALNLGLGEPYTLNQTGIPSETFNRKRVPLCPICGKNPVDFFDYKGTVEIMNHCSDKCEDTARNIRDAQRRRLENGEIL